MTSNIQLAYYLPEKVLTNEMLASIFPSWTAEDIESKTGIYKRHCCADDEIASDCVVKAAEILFTENNIDKSEIDFLIFVTQSQDHASPTTACLIQERLGLDNNIGAFDINLGCTGFIYALSVANGLMISQGLKNILILTSETLTKYIHPKDKSARTIFGDAGAAILVSNKFKIGKFVFGTDGSGSEIMIKRYGSFRFPHTKYRGVDYDDGYGSITNDDYFRMKGQDVFVFAVKRVPGLIREVLQKNEYEMEDIDLFIFHQANGFLLEYLRKKIGIPQEKFFMYLREVGNTVSSTIPIAISEAIKANKIKAGQKVLVAAFGVGLSWSGTVLEF